MPRYFLEVAYKGTAYAGFQSQQNANTIQAEATKALSIILRASVLIKNNLDINIKLTGSSRTDAGVHAAQNFFHFDWPSLLTENLVYKLNAVLPADIAVRSLKEVADTAHARFDALHRTYQYHIHVKKNPFLQEVSAFYPYKLDPQLLHAAAAIIKDQCDFSAFAKTNTQVKNFRCRIFESRWTTEEEKFYYQIKANRFLRGMVRLLVGAQLKVARGNISLENFQLMFEKPHLSGYAAPAVGLHLIKVHY